MPVVLFSAGDRTLVRCLKNFRPELLSAASASRYTLPCDIEHLLNHELDTRHRAGPRWLTVVTVVKLCRIGSR